MLQTRPHLVLASVLFTNFLACNSDEVVPRQPFETSITISPTPTTANSGSTDACRLSHQSSFDKSASKVLLYAVSERLMRGVTEYEAGTSQFISPYYDGHISTILLATPVVATVNSMTGWSLPTQCDGYSRAFSAPDIETEITISTTWKQYFTIRTNASVPFSPYPKTLLGIPLPQGSAAPACTIPPTECAVQWKKFRSFLENWTPDFGDLNAAYNYYRPLLLKEESYLFGNYSFYNASTSGSTYFDRLLGDTGWLDEGMSRFFGGCPEAQTAIKRLCHAKAKNFKSDTSPLEELDDDQLRKLMTESVTCVLRAQHGVLHYFPSKNRPSRDICANNNWGNSVILKKPPGSTVTAVVTAITFPAHKNTHIYNETSATESVLHGKWTFTSPSVYLAINTISIYYPCQWPAMTLRKNIVLTMAPEDLSSLVVDDPNVAEPTPTPRRFNLEDLHGPVPARAYFGNYFYHGDSYEGRDNRTFGSVIVENAYLPRILIPTQVTSVDPVIKSCRPLASLNKVHGFSYEYFSVWDPPVTLVGTTKFAPTATATATAQHAVSSTPSTAKETANSQAAAAAPTAVVDGLTFVAKTGVDGKREYMVVTGSSTATIRPGKPAVTVGDRVLSLDIHGQVYDLRPNTMKSGGKQAKATGTAQLLGTVSSAEDDMSLEDEEDAGSTPAITKDETPSRTSSAGTSQPSDGKKSNAHVDGSIRTYYQLLCFSLTVLYIL